MNQYDISTREAAEKTQPPPPPPPRRNVILGLFRAHRLGQILILIAVLLSALYAARSPLSSIFTPAPPSPPETITVSLTWDEWGDLQNAAWYIQEEISLTVTLAGDHLSPVTIDQAQSTMDRFDALKLAVIDQAFEQTTRVPGEEMDPILDDQLDRQQQLVDLLITLNEARLDWLLDTLQP